MAHELKKGFRGLEIKGVFGVKGVSDSKGVFGI